MEKPLPEILTYTDRAASARSLRSRQRAIFSLYAEQAEQARSITSVLSLRAANFARWQTFQYSLAWYFCANYRGCLYPSNSIRPFMAFVFTLYAALICCEAFSKWPRAFVSISRTLMNQSERDFTGSSYGHMHADCRLKITRQLLFLQPDERNRLQR